MSAHRQRGVALGAALGVLAGVALAGGVVSTPATAAGHEMVTVLVTMDHQADLDDVSGATRRTRLRSLIDTLQTAAADGQEAITARLDTLAAQGSVGDVDPLWVVDALSVTATPAVVAALAARPDVAAVESDVVELVPAASIVEPNIVSTNAPAVWGRGDTGGGVVVATLDSGADVTHPDLASRWRGGANSWFDPYGEHPGAPVDLTGHGTATLGTIVGGDASGSAIGVAPGARWIAARVFDDRGASSATAVHRAFQWLLDPDGNPATADAPQVVNGSWTLGAGRGCDLTFRPDVQALEAAGILPVFAAGNYGSGSGTDASPANYPESLAVGALGDAGTVLSSSSRGPSTCGGRAGTFPDVSAPGRNIMTADRYGLYQVASGTSMAAPQVAGVLALVLAARPGLTAAQQRSLVTAGAADLGPPGPDPDTGYGRVDALASYDLAMVPDFALSVPGSVTVTAGTTVDVPVTVTPVRGFTGDVALSAAATGVVAQVAPPVVPGGSGTATVTLTVPADAPPGEVVLTVTGSSGPVTHAARTTVTVAPAPDFAVTVEPASVTVTAGSPATYTVSVRPTSGSPGDAALTVSPPPGTTASVAPSVLPGATGTSTVTVATPTGIPPGTYPVTIEAAAGGVRRTVTATLAVLAAPPPVRLELSTLGDANPAGLAGTADDADILAWDGSGFRRTVDASAAPWSLPASADVDGFARRDATSFYASFDADVRVSGLGFVQDEDVLLFDGARWVVWFDGTARGLTSASLDLDAISVVGGVLYFSTLGVANPPGVGGVADDADVYRWNGTSFSRVWDASASALPAAANVDGLDVTDATHLALSFSTAAVGVPGLGTTQDEDVVRYAAGVWSTWFDGTAAGMTTEALDVDAFDIP